MTFVTSSTCPGLWIPSSADKAMAKIGAVTLWAENGAVRESKELPNGEQESRQCSPSQARHRRDAIIGIAEQTRAKNPKHPDLKVYAQFIDAYERVIRKAEEQGPYEDLNMRQDRIRRRPKTVSIGLDLNAAPKSR